MADPFYTTAAISHPDGPPHIGHSHEAIATVGPIFPRRDEPGQH
jgi:hypothetical protein